MDISRLDGADSEPRSLSLRVSVGFCFYRCLFVVVLVGVSLSVSVSLSLAPSLRWCLFLFSLCLSLFLLLSACLYLLVARLAFSADGGQKFHICRQVSLECRLGRAIVRGRKIGCATRSWLEDMVSADRLCNTVQCLVDHMRTGWTQIMTSQRWLLIPAALRRRAWVYVGRHGHGMDKNCVCFFAQQHLCDFPIKLWSSNVANIDYLNKPLQHGRHITIRVDDSAEVAHTKHRELGPKCAHNVAT